MRSRIRIQLEGKNLYLQPFELHDKVLQNLEHRYMDHVEESRFTKISHRIDTEEKKSGSNYLKQKLQNQTLIS
jgi:hypothetical protein